MPLNKRQFSRPRYKVIATYPNGYEVGDILLCNNSMDEEYSKHPHLFQKLEWWEEREPEDFMYVKYTSTGEVFEFIGVVEKFPDTAHLKSIALPIVKCWRDFSNLQPASKHEYHIFKTYGLNPLPKLPYVELNIFNERVEEFKEKNFVFKYKFLYGGISSWEQLSQELKEDLYLHLECKPLINQ